MFSSQELLIELLLLLSLIIVGGVVVVVWCIHIEFINRRRIALETERQEISVYTSPLTVLSYFVLYLLHEFRMLLVWIVSQQYLLVVLPLLTAIVYFVYQTDGAHQPVSSWLDPCHIYRNENMKFANDQKRQPARPCTLMVWRSSCSTWI